MSSGGSKTPKNQQITQTTIPDWARPYAMTMLGNAASLTNPTNAYTPYIGGQSGRTIDDVVAPATDLQNASYTGMGNMQVAPQMGEASGLAALAGQTAAGMNYAPGTFNQYQMTQPADVTTGKWTDAGVSQSYMSPYIQNVMERQQRDARRQAGVDSTQRGFRTATSGTFGGNRSSLGDFEANRNLSLQLGDIQAKGLQDAYTQGATQFNQDQGRGLQAGIANQQTGLATGQNNLNALLDVQRLGEQSRQFGAGFGLDALSAQLQSAGLLGQLGSDQFNQQMGILEGQNRLGTQQQELGQRQRDFNYGEFSNALNFPYRQMGFMSDMLHGLPTNQSTTMYGYPNTAGQAVGSLGGLASLYMADRKG